MAQVGGQPTPTGVPTGGQHQLVGPEVDAPSGAAHLQIKPTCLLAHLLERRAGMQGHPSRHGRLTQGGGHRFGAVGAGEQPPIGLLHQLQTVGRKPAHRIARGKTAERTPQRRTTAGVMAHQRAGIPAGMGHVATTAPTDQHLVQRFGGGLQHMHVLGPGFGGRDGGHETGGATTGNHHSCRTRQHG